MSDFDAAPVADDSLELRSLVLSTRAFPVTFGPEDALTEQAVFFRSICAIIDRLRLSHLAERPATNIIRPGQ